MKSRAERSGFVDPNTVREWWEVNRKIALDSFPDEFARIDLPIHAPVNFDVFRIVGAPVGLITEPEIRVVGADAYTVGRRNVDGTHEDVCIMRSQQGIVESVKSMRPVVSMSLVTDMQDLSTLLNLLVTRVQSQVPEWQHCCIVIEEDVERIWAAMCTPVWGHLRMPATWLYVGKGAMERYLKSLDDDARCIPCHIAGQPERVKSAVERLRAILSARTGRGLLAAEKSKEHYGAGFGRSVAARLRRNEPIHVLFYTTKFSSVLQWACRDLAGGFERCGHKISILKEKGPLDHIPPDAVAQWIEKERPDVGVMISHVRHEQGHAFPERMPFVGWIQDAMLGVFSADSGEKDGPDDFIYGLNYTFAKELRRAGYKQPGVLLQAVNDSIYHPYPDVAIEPSILYARNLVDEIEPPQTPGFTAWIDACLQDHPDEAPSVEEFREYVRAGIRRFSWPLRPDSQEFHSVVHAATQIGRKADRCRVVDWLIEAGVPVAIYGSGWDHFPRHAPHWRGRLQQGEELCRAYQSHAAVLQVGQNMHARVFEALASGGCIIAQAQPEDDLPGNIHDNMHTGREMGYFRNKIEAVETAKRALEDPEWRAGIIEQGRERVLRDHTYHARARQIIGDMIARYTADTR